MQNEEPYAYVLNALKELQIIPVVGLDRGPHNHSVVQLKREEENTSSTVAFRAVQEDFEDFELSKDQIDYDLSSVFAEFDNIDLIFDCRVCRGLDVSLTAQQIAAFAGKFCKSYDVRRVIVTGSSIPQTIGDLVKPNNAKIVMRPELAIISKARDLAQVDVMTGDYATVRFVFLRCRFRANAFPKSDGPAANLFLQSLSLHRTGSFIEIWWPNQYVGLTKALCGQTFFRGRGYSTGEDYFDDKRRRIGNNATNGTVVTPSVVAHITYMVLGAKL